MIKYVFITVLCFCFFTNGYTQKTLSNYSYIVIPEQYDFLSEKDKYQINSLTKFLFNKYGFHAFFENELPENFIICDGLKADVIKVRAVLYTKLQIVINDCHGNEVYRSAEGRSKIKEFNKVFNDALRKAFANIIGLEVNQKEISFEEVSSTTEIKKEATVSEEINNNNVVKSSNQETIKATTVIPKFPSKQYNTYKIDNDLFLLRKTNKGYSLYKDVTFNPYAADNNNGLLLLGEVLISKSNVFYLGLKEKLVDAYFDESLNLIIDNSSEKMIYKFID
jgi:hypothetical protein